MYISGSTRLPPRHRHAKFPRFSYLDLGGFRFKLILMRFNIKWQRGAYYVSVPNYDGGEVVTADEVADLERRLAEATDLIRQLLAALQSTKESAE